MRGTVHNQGNIQTALINRGYIGAWFTSSSAVDPLTGNIFNRTIYPRNSGADWWGTVFPAFGGIVDRDTFVTTEFLPDEPPDNEFRYQTIDAASPLYSPEAHSEFDILCTYNDSISDPTQLGRRNHHPLNIRVKQRSMAWSASNIDDFILVDLEISTFGTSRIRDCYMGLAGLLLVKYVADGGGYGATNLLGSLSSFPTVATCDIPDPTTVYYGMNNDGRPGAEGWNAESLLGALGVVILRTPEDAPVSFNWEAIIYLATGGYQYWMPLKLRDVRRGDPTASLYAAGDPAVYAVMSNKYHAYDQMFSAVDHSAEGWKSHPGGASDLAEGGQPELFIGAGPFDLGPNQTMHFTYAYVGGENVHVNPTDFVDYWDPYTPELYYSKLDFTELMTNARWAKWVYDNPGIDTDEDGYFGKFRVCDGDTNWYEGDGVPDFRIDIPPPSPNLKVTPSLNKLVLRWNGYHSENAIDPFTKVKDFEGYRVYWGLDDRESSFSTLISWDFPNYNRYFLREKPNHTFAWETKDLPFTIDSLRILYGYSFSPLLYTKDNPWPVGDTLYSFATVDYNLSSFLPNGVHKVYPDAVNPGTDTTLWTEDQLTTEHGKPLPKYYEYEYIIENMLPTVANYISVTSFDFGFAKGNIPAKESSKRENQTIAYAQTSADSVEANDLNVYIYPNPYIWQKDYHSLGYENRDNTQIPARSHRINFGNLPPKCRISVFSLDGDLIRSWEHNYDSDDPQGMHDSWDLITRNTMLAVAGLYYWVVESVDRTQIGKLVIIE